MPNRNPLGFKQGTQEWPAKHAFNHCVHPLYFRAADGHFVAADRIEAFPMGGIIEGVSSITAAFAVGYESVSQFTREYGRMFGGYPQSKTGSGEANGKCSVNKPRVER